MKTLRKFALIVVPVLGLNACVTPKPFVPTEQSGAGPSVATPTQEAGVQTQPLTTPDAPPAVVQPIPPATSRVRVLSPASRALVTQAQSQLSGGNVTLAAGTIERALRIEPDNPLLFIELAKIRLEGNSPSQAENLARKALTLSSGDNRTQAAAWRVISDSYRARGRNVEARDAAAKAQSLGG